MQLYIRVPTKMHVVVLNICVSTRFGHRETYMTMRYMDIDVVVYTDIYTYICEKMPVDR